MSSGAKVPLAKGQLVAIQLLALLTKRDVPLDVAGSEKTVREDPDAVVEDVLVVGSVRRGSAEVGDVEIVAIPRSETVKIGQPDLFGNCPTEERSRLWDRLEAAVAAGELQRHPSGKSGPKARQYMLDGLTVDVFTAEPVNFGHIVTIRTGGAMFSKLYVTVLRRLGLASEDGRIVAQTAAARKRYKVDSVVPTRTEKAVFEVLGIPFIPPDRRGAMPGDSEQIAQRRWFGGVRGES